MPTSGRRRREQRIATLALVTVSLLVAGAQQPTPAASKKKKRANVPVTAVVAPTPISPAVAPAAVPPSDAAGYWMVGSDGGVYAYGSAPFKGSTGALKLNKPVVGMAPTPGGQGYWLVASDGGIFSFGDAAFRGSTGGIQLNRPIVGMASTPSGQGYWLVASDGGIFAFGDAAFFGSTGNLKLARPITGMAATPGGRGYWLTASDGGLFAFGDARFFGTARDRLAEAGRGVVSIVPTRTGSGYWQVAASGKLFAFGDATALGAPIGPRAAIVGMAARVGTAAAPAPVKPAAAPVSAPSGPAPQIFASAHKPSWGTSPSEVERDKAGRALALAEAGHRVFIGGEFAGMVPPAATRKAADAAPITERPYLAAVDANSGVLLDWDVAPDDAVLALAVSADRRTLYVGGRFENIAGAPATHLAAIDIETRTLRAGFNPPRISDPIKSMVLHGNTLYIGGEFRRVGDADRAQLAALDATTGALRDGFVPPPNGGGYYQGQTGREVDSGSKDGSVHDLGITADGRYLVAGGDFLDFGGRSGLLVVDGATGQPTAWQPAIDRPVHGLTMWPGDSRTFFVATGGTGGQVQAFRIQDGVAPTIVDADDDSDDDDRRRSRSRRSGDSDDADGAEPLWIHKTDGDAEDVVATTERVVLVGHYDYVLGENTVCGSSACEGGRPGDVPNRHISVFEPAGGAHDVTFTGQLNTPQGPYAALIGARNLYVVGDFTEANGAPQPGFVIFPAVR